MQAVRPNPEINEKFTEPKEEEVKLKADEWVMLSEAWEINIRSENVSLQC